MQEATRVCLRIQPAKLRLSLRLPLKSHQKRVNQKKAPRIARRQETRSSSTEMEGIFILPFLNLRFRFPKAHPTRRCEGGIQMYQSPRGGDQKIPKPVPSRRFQPAGPKATPHRTDRGSSYSQHTGGGLCGGGECVIECVGA